MADASLTHESILSQLSQLIKYIDSIDSIWFNESMKYLEKESSTLEFKQQLPNWQQIVKTVVAFCNGFGGKIIIGIDDQQNICGISEENISQTIESLQQSIYQSCTNTILPSIYTQRIHEKLILIIEVSTGMNKPYFVTSLGLQEGTFIRVGTHIMKATRTMLQELSWKGKGISIDEIPVYSASIEEISTANFVSFLKEFRGKFKSTDIQDLFLHYKIFTEEHQRRYPTVGGLLLFGRNPQQYFSEAFIICTHFQGVSGRKVIATQDCLGDLMTQLNDAIHFVVSRLSRQFEIKKIKREEQLEIPEVALREIITNAVIHRDYQLPGPIKIAIYDDRVEIFSPGNFPGPLKTSELEMGITYIRNYIICRVFREAGYVEKLGSGFLTLFNSYRTRNLPTPEVIEGTGFIKCILPRPTSLRSTFSELSESNDILRLFYADNEMSAQEIAKLLNISRQTAARRLTGLCAAKKLQRIGSGPAVRYRKYN